MQNIKRSGPERDSGMIDFVCKKAAEITSEAAALLHDDAWSPSGEWAPLMHLCDPHNEPQWVGEAVGAATEILCNLEMRVSIPCTSYPRLLCWLASAPHDVTCDVRKDICADLLTREPDDF